MNASWVRRRDGFFILAVFCAIGTPVIADVKPAVSVSSLTAKAGEPVPIKLDLAEIHSWKKANVGQFFVRTYGKQRTIDPASGEDDSTVTLTFDEPGLALVVIDVGPESEKGKSDSWQRTTRCTKLVMRVEGDFVKGKTGDGDHRLKTGAKPPRDPGIMSKVGSTVEVLPYMNPADIEPGDDLPVRVYYQGIKQARQSVIAIAPDGSQSTRTSDSVGTATFHITQVGRWLIRFEKEVDGTRYVADLIFEVRMGDGEEGHRLKTGATPQTGATPKKGGKR